MSHLTDRRGFLTQSLQAGLAVAGLGALASAPRARAIEPIARSGGPRFRLSLVGYSFRDYLTNYEARRARAPHAAKTITLFDVIDFCADQGLDAVELTGYFIPHPVTPDDLIKLKRHAYLRGVAISGTSVGNKLAQPDRAKLDEQIAQVKAGVDHAAILGAPYLRVFAGSGKDMQKPGAVQAAIDGMQACAEYAGGKGVFIGLENDGGITPDTVLEIVRGVRSPWFGLNLDLGNYHSRDVYADLVRCAPYAINVHFKMTVQNEGQPAAPADIPRMLGILRQARYQGYLAFEFEAAGDPYQAIPGWIERVRQARSAALPATA